jgi:hypothetical protein
MEIEILTPVDAHKNGYLSLTTPYNQETPQDVDWMRTVITDLKGCKIVLVEVTGGLEIARHKSEMILAGQRI